MISYNLSISCVDGAIEGIISEDKKRVLMFLLQRDHEGSSLNLIIGKDDSIESKTIYDSDEVIKFLHSEETI
jgi:hypothetical protein